MGMQALQPLEAELIAQRRRGSSAACVDADFALDAADASEPESAM
jgi:hypothetical protein